MAGYNYTTANGIIVPDTSTTKADVQTEYTQAFGPDLVLDDATPQGRLIDIETTARDQFVRTMAEFANQINPNVATGVFLESICGLHGIQTIVATFSLASGCILSGTTGTFIPQGSRVATTAGAVFQTLSDVTIGAGGTVTVDMQAQQIGAVVAAAGTLTQILDGVLGWTAATNPTDAVVGLDELTDADLRLLRKALLSQLAKATSEAIKSNVMAVEGVRSVQQRENPSASTATIDGVVMPAHSTWVVVQGGADADIALALFKSKQSGSPWTPGTGNGTPVTVLVTDPFSGQVYTIQFNRGIAIPVAARVTVSQGTANVDPTVAVPDAILNYADGKVPGEVGFVLGAYVSPFELAGAISIANPGLFVHKVEIGTVASGPTFSVNEIPIELWQYATIGSGSITTIIV